MIKLIYLLVVVCVYFDWFCTCLFDLASLESWDKYVLLSFQWSKQLLLVKNKKEKCTIYNFITCKCFFFFVVACVWNFYIDWKSRKWKIRKYE
jgi:hypothetical protein